VAGFVEVASAEPLDDAAGLLADNDERAVDVLDPEPCCQGLGGLVVVMRDEGNLERLPKSKSRISYVSVLLLQLNPSNLGVRALDLLKEAYEMDRDGVPIEKGTQKSRQWRVNDYRLKRTLLQELQAKMMNRRHKEEVVRVGEE
jgi:hypothetical protein